MDEASFRKGRVVTGVKYLRIKSENLELKNGYGIWPLGIHWGPLVRNVLVERSKYHTSPTYVDFESLSGKEWVTAGGIGRVEELFF